MREAASLQKNGLFLEELSAQKGNEIEGADSLTFEITAK